MPREQKDLTLETAAGGVAAELFDRELQAVLENIADRNTDTKARQIALTFSLQPSEDSDGARRTMSISVQAKSRLRPVKPANSYAFLSRVKGGGIKATTHDVRQGSLLEEDEALEEVDESTGEVIPMKDRKAGG